METTMGLMDKVKTQATQLAEKAQQAGQAGQAKLAEVQAKRKADALLLELGGITYTQRMGRAEPGADARATELVGLVQAYEAEHGVVSVTSANAAVAETTGVVDPGGTIPAPGPAPAPPPSAGTIPQAQYGTGES
jgi:hypothetical protein